MDPMLELATQFFAAERPESQALGQKKFPDEIYRDINDGMRLFITGSKKRRLLNSHPSFKENLWEWRDERAHELLANVLYARPELAKRLCEIEPKFCPAFICYLVAEAHKEWQAGRSRKEWSNNGLLQLLEKHGWDVHQEFPAALKLSLLESPDFVEELAAHLQVALPFSLVLKKELDEIRRSREQRLQSDSDAKKAQLVKEVMRTQTRLMAAATVDERKRLEKRLRTLGAQLQEPRGEVAADGRLHGRSWRAQFGTGAHSLFAAIREAAERFGQRLWYYRQPDHSRSSRDRPARYYPLTQAERMSLFGLALSGGGIRSATFNLGLLQSMADLDLLRRLDYISSVSGGSYISAWLAAWIKRQHDGIRRVQRWLSPLRSPTPDTRETYPIQFLRKFSNYLAPRKGLLSPDSWSIVSVWLRNTFLNQIVFALLICSLLGVPRLLLFLFDHNAWFWTHEGALGSLAIALTLLLAILIGLNLRRFDREDRLDSRERRRTSPLWNQFGVLTTVIVGFWILGLIGSVLLAESADDVKPKEVFWSSYAVMFCGLLVAQSFARSWRSFFSYRTEGAPTRWAKAGAIMVIIIFSAVSALVGSALVYEVSRYLWSSWPSVMTAKYLCATLVFGPAVIITALSLAMVLQIGLMGHNLPDSRREWWSRLGATLLIVFGIWTAFSACSLYGPWLVLWSWRNAPGKSILAVFVWLATTWIGFSWGRSAQTPVPKAEGKGAKSLEWIVQTAPREWIARAAPHFYVAGLTILLSFLLYALNCWFLDDSEPSLTRYWTASRYLTHPLWLPAAMLGLAFILAWRFDVNEFSMHHFYRNRLTRCYLGASRALGLRNPNPFTGFDPDDDLSLSELQVNPPVPQDLTKEAGPYYGPLLIINTALNLVTGKELAWQDRKAASFVFTPLYCGYEPSPTVQHHKNSIADYGYRPTVDYAEPKSFGPSLGTAIAISGAAANPNMGYHSSPALSFLMALFNARLGCWLGNTRHRKTWKRSSPSTGLTYLVNELIGNTDDTSWFINLSDGGHFDNLGLYELVRRRCKYIIVSDAEEDSSFRLKGLGDAIRKCRTDFGVDIRINPDVLRPVTAVGRSRAHCAVGEIVYSTEARGTLLYIKTSLTGDEPGDVLEYKLGHSTFPHQSTLNQFFTESQFESYRALGKHVATVILERASKFSPEDLREHTAWAAIRSNGFFGNNSSPAEMNEKYLTQLFRYLRAMWYPPTRNMAAMGEQHSRLYAELLEMFQADRDRGLALAARTFFRTSHWRRNLKPEFFAHAMMIELMHRVFHDLELESMAEHPHNEGWMSMFRDWTAERRFRRAWEVVKGNYDTRFQNFCAKEFGLYARESTWIPWRHAT